MDYINKKNQDCGMFICFKRNFLLCSWIALLSLLSMVWTTPIISKPKMPNMPYPNMPSIPNIPNMPSIPSIPSMPSNPYQNKKSMTKKQQKPKQKTIKRVQCLVKITLNKQSNTRGHVYLTNTPIIVSIQDGDFHYRKTLQLKDIRRIRITKWQSKIAPNTYPKSKKTSNDKTQIHQFYPIQFQIRTRKKQSFLYDGRIPFLEKFKLTNSIGTTQIYSVFYGKQSQDKIKNSARQRTQGHPLSLKQIEFLSVNLNKSKKKA